MSISSFVGGLFDRLFVVAGAFVGSQIPSFVTQYTQRLSGHVAELEHLVDGMKKTAALSGKTVESYIGKFTSNPDPDFSRQGELMQHLVIRWQELSQSLQNLMESTIWTRPFVFMTNWNSEVAEGTLASFQPSITLSVEGLCYTGAGILAGYLSCQLITWLIKALKRRALTFSHKPQTTHNQG